MVRGSTVLCAGIALALRLNLLAAIQAANYAAMPLQLLLIAPFVRLGAWLVTTRPAYLLTPRVLLHFLRGQPGCRAWSGMAGQALLAWLLVAVPAVVLLTPTLTLMLRRIPLLQLKLPKPATEVSPTSSFPEPIHSSYEHQPHTCGSTDRGDHSTYARESCTGRCTTHEVPRRSGKTAPAGDRKCRKHDLQISGFEKNYQRIPRAVCPTCRWSVGTAFRTNSHLQMGRNLRAWRAESSGVGFEMS